MKIPWVYVGTVVHNRLSSSTAWTILSNVILSSRGLNLNFIHTAVYLTRFTLLPRIERANQKAQSYMTHAEQ